MASFATATLSRSVQTDSDTAEFHNKKSVYEKVDDSIRYRLIQMVSFHTLLRGNFHSASLSLPATNNP